MKTVFLYKSNVSCETNSEKIKKKYFAKVKQNQISPTLLYSFSPLFFIKPDNICVSHETFFYKTCYKLYKANKTKIINSFCQML